MQTRVGAFLALSEWECWRMQTKARSRVNQQVLSVPLQCAPGSREFSTVSVKTGEWIESLLAVQQSDSVSAERESERHQCTCTSSALFCSFVPCFPHTSLSVLPFICCSRSVFTSHTLIFLLICRRYTRVVLSPIQQIYSLQLYLSFVTPSLFVVVSPR
jgi:hypothetical protein